MRPLHAIAAVCVFALAPQARAENVRVQTDGGAYALNVTSWRDLPFRTVVRQRYDFSCGSAALATLLRYHYGVEADEAGLFEAMYAVGDQARIRQQGFSLLDMQRHLQGIGLRGDGYRMSLDRLAQLQTPAIAIITTRGYRHFVVIKGVRGDRVLVGDPVLGMSIQRRAAFEDVWNGVAFVIHGQGAHGQFNRQDEWEARPPPAFGIAATPNLVEPFTREGPVAYQISPVVQLLQ